MGVAFNIGSLEIRWYGIMLVIGIIAAMLLARAEAKRRGENPDHIYTAMLLVVPLGFIGARAYHVIDQWSYYSQTPVEIFGGAGLGIFGAVIGGAIGGIIYTKWKKLNTLRWFDICAPGLILAQAIGRWGNYFNQELYGPPTDLPWGITITNVNQRIPPYNDLTTYPLTTLFHPDFLYESIWNLIGFGLMMWIGRKYAHKLLDGDMLSLYLIWYPVGRILVEMLRPDAWIVSGIPTAQIVSVILILIGVGLAIYRRRQPGLATSPLTHPAQQPKRRRPARR